MPVTENKANTKQKLNLGLQQAKQRSDKMRQEDTTHTSQFTTHSRAG